MDFEVRPPTDDELAAWFFVDGCAFGFVPDDEGIAIEHRVHPRERMIATLEGGHVVGAAGSYPFEMTVPGGAAVPVAGVTAVAVAATHRRRGALTGMMRYQLDDVAARGDVAAVLNASESIIYSRYGYGLANLYQAIRVDTRRAAYGSRVPTTSGALRLVPKHEAAPLLAAAWDRCRPHRPGEVSRSADWWDVVLGDTEVWKGGGELFVLVHLDAGGAADGYALYRMARPDGGARTVTVRELVAADPAVRAALWRQLLDLDLVDVVELTVAPVDEPLRWWLADGRQAEVVALRDYLWVRPLDVEALFSARALGGDEPLVVEVLDEFRPAVAGAYRFEPGPAGEARCHRTDDAPDLVMDVGELGSLTLGGAAPPSFLGQVGRIHEARPGALAAADGLFGWPVASCCVTRF